MTYRVIVTPTAEAEAMETFRWYAERSPEVAERWLADLERAIAGLADHPDRRAVLKDESEALGCEVRRLLHGRRRAAFRILYTIRGDTVWVLRIRHGARGPL
ncbi:MAG: type II toxin-antitoxin system RelE/ParE family toxin [Isosphaeraceae bacterium]